MGYDLHITRQAMWYDEREEQKIILDEWLAYIDKDEEMRRDDFAEATTPAGETVRVTSKGLAVWTKYSGDGIDGNHAWFALLDGNVVVKNPDEEIIRKMITIAAQLNARVQGDESELYEAGSNETGFKIITLHSYKTSKKKPWWRFW